MSELVDQGRLLRDRQDFYAAVTKLREAQVLDPTNPAPLYELAMTYEKMGFTDPAAETWKKIYDMGNAAGVYYSAAEAKLNASKAQALLEAQPNQPGAVAPSAPNEPVGLGAASKLGFASIERTDGSDPQLLQKINFALAIKAKARARIDAADVAVKVLFYDLVPDP